MNLILMALYGVALGLWICGFWISFSYFKKKKFPTIYNVREYKDGVLTAEYKEISGYNERVPSPAPLSPLNSGTITEEPVCQENSMAPPKKIGRPKKIDDNKIIVEYDEMSL